MNTYLYALITLIVILSLYSIRHRNSVCYYPNNLLTWQRVLCVYSNTAMALCEAIFHLWSHLYQIDILIQIQRSHGMFVCYSYMRCWRRDQIWSVMVGCFIIWHFLSFLLWVILRYFTLLTRQKNTNIDYSLLNIYYTCACLLKFLLQLQCWRSLLYSNVTATKRLS